MNRGWPVSSAPLPTVPEQKHRGGCQAEAFELLAEEPSPEEPVFFDSVFAEPVPEASPVFLSARDLLPPGVAGVLVEDLLLESFT